MLKHMYHGLQYLFNGVQIFMVLPQVLDQVRMKLSVGFLALDIFVIPNESIKFRCSIMGNCHPFSHIFVVAYILALVVEVVIIVITLVFNNNVMHYDASHHNIMERLFIPQTSWTTNNSKARLENPKCPLNILSTSFLCPCKVFWQVFFSYYLVALEWSSQKLPMTDISHLLDNNPSYIHDH